MASPGPTADCLPPHSLFKSLPSLWGRQIPYTMMKFWSFEATVAAIYNFLGKPKDQYNKVQQLGVSAAAGYFAGIFCAVVSHPADTCVSSEPPSNIHQGATATDLANFSPSAELNAPLKPGQAKPTLGSIYAEIGFGGLWSGLGTRIFMVGTLTALQWLIYDTFKVTMGLPTTGSAAPDPTKK